MLAGRLHFLAALVHRGRQPLEAHPQAVQVTDAVGLRHGLQQPLHGRLGLRGRDLGGGHPLLDERDLGFERLVLPPEEHERLFRAPRRPRADHPLAIGRTHVDRPVVVYPAPRIVGGGHGEPPVVLVCARPSGRHVLLSSS